MQNLFVQIPSIPSHEINRLGEVRRISDGKVSPWRVKHHSNESTSTYVWCQPAPKVKQVSRTLNVLLYEVFGEGAATAVGLPEPRKNTYRRAKDEERSMYIRKCATCGRPTTNYRCSKCWSEIRSQYDCN